MLTPISEAQFRARYSLERQLTEQGVRTYVARDAADHLLMVHVLGVAGEPANQGRLATVDGTRPQGIVGAFLIGDAAVLVTEFIQDLQSFDAWLASAAGAETEPDSPSTAGPGEFTQMFGSMPQDGAGADGGTPEEPATRVPDGVVPQDSSARKPSEFTSMFGPPADTAGPAGPQQPEDGKGEATELFGKVERVGQPEPPMESAPPPPSPPAERPQASAPPADKQESGEPRGQPPREKPRIVWKEDKEKGEELSRGPVVRWKSKDPNSVDKPSTSPPPAAESRPGERSATPPSPPAAPIPDEASSAPRGEFTEMFGPGLGAGDRKPDQHFSADNRAVERDRKPEAPRARPAPPASPQKPLGAGSDATSIDYRRALDAHLPAQAEHRAAVPESQPTVPQDGPPVEMPPPLNDSPAPPKGPSEYTQIVGARPVQAPGIEAGPGPEASPAPTSEPEETAAPKVPAWLWISLVTIVVVAILLVVLLAVT